MNFIERPSDPHFQWTHYRVSEEGGVHIGVHRVLYGFRVRAGYRGDKLGCYCDWCGGANWKDVERLYSLCLAILSQREEPGDNWRHAEVFEGMPPVSSIKPFYLDEEFTKKVTQLAGPNLEMISLMRPEVADMLERVANGSEKDELELLFGLKKEQNEPNPESGEVRRGKASRPEAQV